VPDVDPRITLLRRVDGLAHVVLGPLLLAALAPLERVTGVPRATLTAVLAPFTIYGFVVVAATRKRHASTPPWLVPLAVAVNASAVAVGSAGLKRRGTTRWGRGAAGGLAIGGRARAAGAPRSAYLNRSPWTILLGDSCWDEPAPGLFG
jgi:hypothetical protein